MCSTCLVQKLFLPLHKNIKSINVQTINCGSYVHKNGVELIIFVSCISFYEMGMRGGRVIRHHLLVKSRAATAKLLLNNTLILIHTESVFTFSFIICWWKARWIRVKGFLTFFVINLPIRRAVAPSMINLPLYNLWSNYRSAKNTLQVFPVALLLTDPCRRKIILEPSPMLHRLPKRNNILLLKLQSLNCTYMGFRFSR